MVEPPQVMGAEDFVAILDYLELDDEAAALAFGKEATEIAAMRSGALPVPFLISALTVLMTESFKATRLALEHGRAMRAGEPSLAMLLADAIGVGFVLPAARSHLRLVD